MENTKAFVFSILLILACFIANSNGKRQTESLSHLYQTKLQKNTLIDTKPFRPNAHFPKPRILSEEGLKEKDLITSLPGQPKVSFKQYAGYISVDVDRALFYYFVEADPKNASELPLLLWLNGGPGCSSLGFGAMEELGPFRVKSDGKTLYQNEYAWNHVANVLFLETPVGVGFSYSKTNGADKSGGDKRTASDNYIFLEKWLERFPEYKYRYFYIAGESYAGHYVPQLAHTILHENLKTQKNIINMKGIIIGNAAINDKTDLKGMYEYFESHALISDDTINEVLKYCNFSPKSNFSDECTRAMGEANKNWDEYIDIFNIYAPLCFNLNLTNTPKDTSVLTFDPCSDVYVNAYLNRLDVQKALHVNVTATPYKWESCSNISWTDSPSTVLPILHNLLTHGIKVTIYSGDIDARVPFRATQLSIKQMKLSVQERWHPIYAFSSETTQNAGFATVYEEGLQFITVRGAGHQVASDKPDISLALITGFLQNISL